MLTQFLVCRIATQAIEGAIKTWAADPYFEGPVDPDHPAPTVTPAWEVGTELIEWEGDFSKLGPAPSQTAVIGWNGVDPLWVERGSIDDQRAHKSVAISQACSDAILAGFACNALGAGYTYPAKFTDQLNLAGSVMDSVIPGISEDWTTPFWCVDADGVWAFRQHTASEIQQVGRCAKATALACMTLNEQLQAQIIAAESPAALAQINWPD